jgi:hypothetical protein
MSSELSYPPIDSYMDWTVYFVNTILITAYENCETRTEANKPIYFLFSSLLFFKLIT